jgi:hypothetical protein
MCRCTLFVERASVRIRDQTSVELQCLRQDIRTQFQVDEGGMPDRPVAVQLPQIQTLPIPEAS